MAKDFKAASVASVFRSRLASLAWCQAYMKAALSASLFKGSNLSFGGSTALRPRTLMHSIMLSLASHASATLNFAAFNFTAPECEPIQTLCRASYKKQYRQETQGRRYGEVAEDSAFEFAHGDAALVDAPFLHGRYVICLLKRPNASKLNRLFGSQILWRMSVGKRDSNCCWGSLGLTECKNSSVLQLICKTQLCIQENLENRIVCMAPIFAGLWQFATPRRGCVCPSLLRCHGRGTPTLHF